MSSSRPVWSTKHVLKVGMLCALARPVNATLNFVGPGEVRGRIVAPSAAINAASNAHFTLYEAAVYNAMAPCAPLEKLLRGTQWPPAELLAMRPLPLKGVEIGLSGADAGLAACITKAAEDVSIKLTTEDGRGNGLGILFFVAVAVGLGMCAQLYSFLELQNKVAKKRLAAAGDIV